MALGVCYVVYGEAARLEAMESIRSLRRYHGDWPVWVVGDREVPGAEWVELPAEDHTGRWAKLSLDTIVPWEQWLYLDADTRVHGDLAVGFTALDDGWDMVITPSAMQGSDCLWHIGAEDRFYTLAITGPEPLQLQAGLWFARKTDRMRQFFAAWREEWECYRGQDQGALLRALWRIPVRIWLLGRDFNGGAVVEHRFGKAVSR